MSEPWENEVVREFRERVRRADPMRGAPEDVRVVYRVYGGMPEERIDVQFELTGGGQVTVEREDALAGIPREEASGELDPSEARALLDQLEKGIDSLVPREQARFLPDSVVGTVTVEVDGRSATRYFLPEEEERIAQDKAVAPPMTSAIQQIEEISERLLKGKGEEGRDE